MILIAEPISIKGVNKLIFSAFNLANSSGLGGISGVFKTDQLTEAIEQMLPKKKLAYTQ